MSRGDLEVVGDLRTLARNSPMVSRERRSFEVQIPVQFKPSPSARIVVDFRDARESARWQPVDDRVMGGVSVSRLEATSSGSSLFTGELSLENNGGFASVRAPLAGAPGSTGALAGARELVLGFRGDGKAYKLRLRTESFDGVNYEARFETQAGVQAEHAFALTDFVPVWRGRPISEAQTGRFRLELFSLALR